MSQEAANTTPKEDCIAFETISIVVPSLNSLTDAEGKPKPLSSPVHNIGGLAWRMEVRKVAKEEINEPTRLYLYVFCNEEVKDHLWLCKVFFTVHIGCSDPSDKLTYNYNHFYGFNTYYWIVLDIFNENDIDIIPDPENSPIEIKLDIKIFHVHQKSLPPLDTNLVVNIGERKSETLLVSKYLLASFSSYFRNLFFEDWNNKKKQEGNSFELNETDDFDMEAFKFMLYGAMTMGGMVQEANLNFSSPESVSIIKLGVKFDMVLMVDYCEKSLMKNCPYPKMKLLEVADQYGLVQLKEHCLNEMSVLDFVENFGFHSRLSKTTQEELQVKLDEKAGELRESTLGLEADIREDKPKPDLVNRSKKLTNALLGKK